MNDGLYKGRDHSDQPHAEDYSESNLVNFLESKLTTDDIDTYFKWMQTDTNYSNLYPELYGRIYSD